MKNNFPTEIYVVIDDPHAEATLVASVDPKELCSSDAVAPMARYTLAGYGEIVNESKYTEQVHTPDE